MRFNVSQLLKEPNGTRQTEEVEEEFPSTGVRSSPVRGTVTFLRTDKGVWVSARLDSSEGCSCSRCLDEYEQPVHIAIEEEYLPLVDVATGARLRHLDDDREGFFIDQAHTLDLSEAVRQYSALSIPMKPLCSDDCAGICLTCGANLNDVSCACERDRADSRWGPLRELAAASGRES